MAKEHGAEALDVDAQDQRPASDEVELLRAQPGRCPFDAVEPRIVLIRRTRDRAVAVASDEGRASLTEELEALQRLRPEEEVAARQQQVGPLGVHLRERRLERRKVPMHVVESSNPSL